MQPTIKIDRQIAYEARGCLDVDICDVSNSGSVSLELLIFKSISMFPTEFSWFTELSQKSVYMQLFGWSQSDTQWVLSAFGERSLWIFDTD